MGRFKEAVRRQWPAVAAYLALTVIFLAITWHFAGYAQRSR